jgi:hypothetical protein
VRHHEEHNDDSSRPISRLVVYPGTVVAVVIAAETGFRLGPWLGAMNQTTQR